MNALKMILVTVLSMAAFAGCAKKDSNFASKYAKNTMGAAAINADASATAYQNAGFFMDFIDIRTVDYGTSGTFQFSTTIVIGEVVREVRTSINASSTGLVFTNTINMAGRRVDLAAKCSDSQCTQYFFVATAYEGNQAKLQLGYKFVRMGTVDNDKYQALGTTQITSVENMMSYLNSN